MSVETQSMEKPRGSEDSETPIDVLHERIESALRGALDREWEEVLDEWTDAAPSQRKAVQAYVSGLRNRILGTLLDIDTEEELKRGLATQYIEMKCHWTMLNTQIQHQTARKGGADENLIYRASCVSLIIQNLEPLLSRERIDRLTAMLAEPLQ